MRYYLFAYYIYYPGGGGSDCVLKTDSVDEINTYILKDFTTGYTYDFYEVLDSRTGIFTELLVHIGSVEQYQKPGVIKTLSFEERMESEREWDRRFKERK